MTIGAEVLDERLASALSGTDKEQNKQQKKEHLGLRPARRLTRLAAAETLSHERQRTPGR